MKKKCFWTDEEYKASSALDASINASHLIVGGGVAGLFAAYFLHKKGVKDIVIIEKDTVGSGSTGYSAGMLVGEIETAPWGGVIKRYGGENAALYLQAQKDAQNEVSELIKNENINCEYMRGDLYLLISKSWSSEEKDIEQKLRHSIGERIQFLSGAALQNEFRSERFSLGERVEQSISVNPLKFAHGVAEYLRRRGVKIYENTPFLQVTEKVARTPEGNIHFENILYARGTTEHHHGLSNFITSIGVTRPLSTQELHHLHLMDKDMFLDEGEHSYHYGKVTQDNRLLVGFGDVLHDSPKTIVPLHMPHYENIQRFIRDSIGRIPLDYAWSAAYSLHHKELPLVNWIPNGVTIAGAGTQIASIATASYVVNALCNETHPLSALFDN